MSLLASTLIPQGKRPYIGRSLSVEECQKSGIAPYKPSQELVNAVNLAIFLEKRPLLLKGEPGCGKTRLAEAVAQELGLPYEAWYIKSTTRAKDGFYMYDAVARLHDAQLAHTEEDGKTKVDNIKNYIKLGPLGRAFLNQQPTVVLIDEIDKADLDFPNDLLRELDEQQFMIDELRQTIKAIYPPIIFITSNDEKDLPDAFLRRCLFYYIDFPSSKQLVDIVNAHFPASSPNLVEAVVERFHKLREQMDQSKSGKKVSTSELLDWFSVLRQFSEDQVIQQLQGELPFAEILLKKWEDHLRYVKRES